MAFPGKCSVLGVRGPGQRLATQAGNIGNDECDSPCPQTMGDADIASHVKALSSLGRARRLGGLEMSQGHGVQCGPDLGELCWPRGP